MNWLFSTLQGKIKYDVVSLKQDDGTIKCTAYCRKHSVKYLASADKAAQDAMLTEMGETEIETPLKNEKIVTGQSAFL